MSIRARLLLLVMAAVVLPSVLVALRFLNHLHEDVEAAVRTLAVASNDVAAELNARVLGTAQLEYGLARAVELESTDRQACSAFLAAVREEYSQYTGILTIAPDGKLVCDSLLTARELDLADRQYFRKASALPSGVAQEPAFGRLTGISVLQIASPARSADGVLRFVLLASFNLDKFVQDRTSRGFDILLAARDGTVLAVSPGESTVHAPGSSIRKEALFDFAAAHAGSDEAQATAVIDRKVWALAASSEMRASGLLVLVGQSETALLAQVYRRFGEEMAVLATVAIVLFLGVWLLAEFAIRRQVTRIAAMAAELGAGNLGARIPPPHPRGELGGLMTILNGMAASLEDQQTAIAELNQKLRQSQKMEAVGQLTGGVAHDFNNILMVIMANVDALEEETHDPGIAAQVAAIGAATDRAADLTRQLLAFSRKQPLRPQHTNVNDLVTTTGELLRRTLGEQIEVDSLFEEEIWDVEVDRAQLDSALVNLCINARDAMPAGGRLLIETANTRLDAAQAAGHPDARAGEYVMLSVTDSGEGIAPGHLDRVFEPFFTTKQPGKGTGLGLSMVYGFITQSQGYLTIDSEVGRGTSVKMYLPRSRSEARAQPERFERNLVGGSERILVVEDNAQVRASVVGQLRSLGYAIEEAADARAALAAFGQATAPFDLLLTDIIMPGPLNGKALADEVKRRSPSTRTLFMSGYSDGALIHNDRVEAGVLLLTKPFKKSDLARMVRRALQATHAPA